MLACESMTRAEFLSYCDAIAMCEAEKVGMPAAEFVAYWLGADAAGEMNRLQEAEENLGEREAQFASERGLFGDAGPGQGYLINALKVELAAVKRRLKSLGEI